MPKIVRLSRQCSLQSSSLGSIIRYRQLHPHSQLRLVVLHQIYPLSFHLYGRKALQNQSPTRYHRNLPLPTPPGIGVHLHRTLPPHSQ